MWLRNSSVYEQRDQHLREQTGDACSNGHLPVVPRIHLMWRVLTRCRRMDQGKRNK